MRALSLFRTLAFRIVLVYVAVFALSTGALLAFTYWNTERALDAETDQTIEAEISGLQEQYQRLGLNGLADVINSRSKRSGQGLYLLSYPARGLSIGNLDHWPQIVTQNGMFLEFDYQRRNGADFETRRARGKVFAIRGGLLLLVARDVHERYETTRLFTTALPWTTGLMLLIGLIGGGLVSRNLLVRLESINRTSREIMAGDLSRRVPVTRANDEYDTLADNLNQMLERIERLMRGMRDVTDSIAHDLRSPLNRLRNRLESVLRHVTPDSDESREIESAISETDRLIGTFNALLLITEAETGTIRETMTAVDLKSVIHDMAELYEPVAEEKGVKLDVATPATTVIDGNKSLISQALANLIDNAIKYTPPDGRVSISAPLTPRGVALTVADNGPGIPSQDRARVLERFVRLEASRNSPGLGLGLSLVSAVAHLHDAKLELGDNHPGLRATLYFRQSARRQIAKGQA
jgi:signal transduction histidine kinase